MDVEWLRKVCLAFPGATEQIQWGNDLLFKVGGRCSRKHTVEPAPVCLSFKASPENFAANSRSAWILFCALSGSRSMGRASNQGCFAADELARLLLRIV